MTKSNKNSKVRQKLTAAIALLENENPGQPIRISALCRVAGVNRSNIYASHADLIAKLKRRESGNFTKEPASRNTVRSTDFELGRLRLQNKALLYLCVELKSTISDMEKRLARNSERKHVRKL